jgi:hypothetical protein
MNNTRKLGLALFAAMITAANALYTTQLHASMSPGERCGSYYCTSDNPGVCGASCGCGVGLGKPQCWGA